MKPYLQIWSIGHSLPTPDLNYKDKKRYMLLLCIKYIVNKDLLCRGKQTQCFVIAHTKKNLKIRKDLYIYTHTYIYIHIHISLNHFAGKCWLDFWL